MESRGPFIVAHAVKQEPKYFTVGVYRTNRRASLAAALKRAQEIRRAGYLVWIERSGRLATR